MTLICGDKCIALLRSLVRCGLDLLQGITKNRQRIVLGFLLIPARRNDHLPPPNRETKNSGIFSKATFGASTRCLICPGCHEYTTSRPPIPATRATSSSTASESFGTYTSRSSALPANCTGAPFL